MYVFSMIHGALTLLLVIWIYNDAEIHGQDGMLWAIVVFFLSLPAVIVYFLFFRQGIAPARRHKATNRNEDFLIRSKYVTGQGSEKNGGSGGQGTGHMYGRAITDPEFSDPELEHMIELGKLTEARAWLDDMVKIAKEMNDEISVLNYSRYHSKIGNAAKRSGK